jgi:hypothetical protein
MYGGRYILIELCGGGHVSLFVMWLFDWLVFGPRNGVIYGAEAHTKIHDKICT